MWKIPSLPHDVSELTGSEGKTEVLGFKSSSGGTSILLADICQMLTCV